MSIKVVERFSLFPSISIIGFVCMRCRVMQPNTIEKVPPLPALLIDDVA